MVLEKDQKEIVFSFMKKMSFRPDSESLQSYEKAKDLYAVYRDELPGYETFVKYAAEFIGV
jgi:hypothetical protein